jgi:hypothetical protein
LLPAGNLKKLSRHVKFKTLIWGTMWVSYKKRRLRHIDKRETVSASVWGLLFGCIYAKCQVLVT